jgi:type IV secretory pathway VirB3-like protein
MMIATESTAIISDTDMTTPLLAATTTTTTELESVTAVNSGGGTTSRHERATLDSGTASVEQVRAMLNTRPYIWFRLDTKCIPPTLPLLLQQRGVTIECWLDFWSHIKGLIHGGEQNVKSFTTYILIGIYLSLIMYVTVFIIVFARVYWAYIVIPLLFVPARLLMIFDLRRKQILVDNIATYCKDSREAEAFQANGYALECEILPSEVSKSWLHLFILPVDKPYARFEVYNGWLTLQGWNDTHVSAQDGTCTMPPMFDSVPLEDWSNFWAQLGELNAPQERFNVKVFMVEMLTLVIALPATILADSDAFFAVLLFGVLVMSFVYQSYHYNAFLGAKATLVYDTAVRWAPRGVYLEHRRLMYVHSWLGLLERHYVYLFRLANDNTNCVEDPDDSRSLASGVRNRQSIGISGSRLSDGSDA